MKIVRYLYVICFLVTFCANAQEKFQGYIHYKASLSYVDSNLILKNWNVALYTNDTVVRVETETGQLGIQVYIRHMSLSKSYLLLEVDSLKFAIQTDIAKRDSTVSKDSILSSYTFKKKFLKSKKIEGQKCVCYKITFKSGYSFNGYFAKKIENKYLEVYKNIPGLAMDYQLVTADGIERYVVSEIKNTELNRDLFGVPSDYKRVSFNELLHQLYGEKK